MHGDRHRASQYAGRTTPVSRSVERQQIGRFRILIGPANIHVSLAWVPPRIGTSAERHEPDDIGKALGYSQIVKRVLPQGDEICARLVTHAPPEPTSGLRLVKERQYDRYVGGLHGSNLNRNVVKPAVEGRVFPCSRRQHVGVERGGRGRGSRTSTGGRHGTVDALIAVSRAG